MRLWWIGFTENSDAPKLYFVIAGSIMSTQPDVALNIHVRDRKAEIYVEAFFSACMIFKDTINIFRVQDERPQLRTKGDHQTRSCAHD